MTTLDQIRLLETKVESAVAKMQQLQAENDALRNKCAELTNALESKTEQLLSFTTNKEEIEEGIKNALDRLKYIETSMLSTDSNPLGGQGSIHITPGAGLSSIEPITENTQSDNNSVSNEGFVDNAQEYLENSSVASDNSGNYASDMEGQSSSNVEENTDSNFQSPDTNNNYSSSESTDRQDFTSGGMSQQPETASSEDSENSTDKNNADDGEQDAFEYDIF